MTSAPDNNLLIKRASEPYMYNTHTHHVLYSLTLSLSFSCSVWIWWRVSWIQRDWVSFCWASFFWSSSLIRYSKMYYVCHESAPNTCKLCHHRFERVFHGFSTRLGWDVVHVGCRQQDESPIILLRAQPGLLFLTVFHCSNKPTISPRLDIRTRNPSWERERSCEL